MKIKHHKVTYCQEKKKNIEVKKRCIYIYMYVR